MPLTVHHEAAEVSRLFGCYLNVVKLRVRLACMFPVILRTILRWEN